jgi:hypothetical protein
MFPEKLIFTQLVYSCPGVPAIAGRQASEAGDNTCSPQRKKL